MSSPKSVGDMNPAVSVVMSVYNGAPHVAEAIESILSQTFTDFEFIIIDDGSTDGTAAILNKYAQQDSRIVLVTKENSGLTKSLNKGILTAKGQYIARQDADDVSYPARLQKQVDAFKVRSDLVLIGGCSDDLHENGHKTFWKHHNDDDMRFVVFNKTPFPHSTAMMRADICWKIGCYDESFVTAQDMELWMRFAREGNISMIKEPILLRRVNCNSISVKRRWRQFYDALRARLKHGPSVALAFYHSLRSLLISFLPPMWIDAVRRKCKHS